jgi:outer membrane receptor protein involved in Fe transport
VLLLFAPPASPQAVSGAKIHGVVTDSSGAVISGATVSAYQTSSGAATTGVSSSSGEYLLPDLAVGKYTLRITASGFKTFEQTGIVLQVGNDVRIDATLAVGAETATVTVSASVSQVQTEDNAVSTVVDPERTVDLPLNGRNAASLVLLSGAALSTGNGNMTSSKTYGNTGTNAIGGALNISVSGAMGNANNYVLDGGDNNDANYSVNLPFPFPDALEEFSVETTGLSSQYGVHPGARVSVVTKSGSNEWHGGAFEFLRNNYANASNRITGLVDTLKRNQYGGELGGPIKRNKIFFFGGFQQTALRITPSGSTANIPTAAMIAGNWTPYFQALQGTGACPFSQTGSSSAQAKYASLTTAGFTLNSTACTATISPTLYSTAAKNLMQYLPTSTTQNALGSVVYGVPQPQNESQAIGRIDVPFSSKQSMFLRFFGAHYTSAAYFNGDLLNVINTGLVDNSISVTAGDTYSFTPSIINQLRITTTDIDIVRATPADLINFKDLGANVTSPEPNFVYISVSGGFTAACGSCAPAGIDTVMPIQVADDLSFQKGSHFIQVGAEWLEQRWNNSGLSNENGQFTFAGTYSGYALADLMLGAASSFQQANGAPATLNHTRQKYSGYYAQDTWHVSRKLTANFGVRWEPYDPAFETNNKGQSFSMANFTAGTHSIVFPNAPAGLIFYGDPGVSRGFINHDLKDFSPRLGIAYAPSQKQSIRASFGLMFDAPTDVFQTQNWASGVPFADTTILTENLTLYKDTFDNPWQQVPGGNPFPTVYPPPSNVAFPTSGIAPQEDPANQKHTYVQQWNLSYEYQLTPSWFLSANYLGTHTVHLWGYIPVNYGLDVNLLAKDGGGPPTANNTAQRMLLYLATGGTGAGATYGAFNTLADYGMANYNALVVTVKHSMSRNFTVLANYTYSHCLTNENYTGDNDPPPQNPNNTAAEYGNCNFDATQNLTVSGVFITPRIGNGWENAALGGWKFSPLLSRHTGTPFTVTTGGNNSLTGIGQDRPNLNPAVSPYLKNLNPTSGFPTWLNPAAFVVNPLGTFGTEEPFQLRGPGFLNIDMALSKVFTIRERLQMELRGEAFNAFNHPNFSNPVSAMSSTATFGQITSAGTPRILEIATKFTF